MERIKSLAQLTRHEYEDMVLMVTPTNAAIAIYKAKDQNKI